MEDAVIKTLAEIEAWGREHDAQESEHGKKMLNLEPDTARLLSILVQSGRRNRLLEVGTSNGYSTVWLAWAARQNNGHVISIEHSAEKRAMAEENLRRVGLRDTVTLYEGEAERILEEFSGPFDFVFLDADRRIYPTYLALLMTRLTPDVLITADNVHSHPQEIAEYLKDISALPEFEHVVVGVGKGLSIAHRREGKEY